MARQLTHCRRSSTLINYQARWVTYRAWCRRLGHSISQPSFSKIADFLLYLRRSLHLSYSSIASYRSMLSAVFRFVLPEVSSHPVLHDLLHSFRIECPLPSSRVPPWDLLRVLVLLRGPPFEPLSSCSLRDLFLKVLFLVSLATARRVGELQVVSASVSFSGDDIFLSYLPEFRAKSESASNPLGLFVSGCCGILWATYLTNYYFVLCALYGFICIVLPFSLLVLSLFLLVLLLVLSLRMPKTFSFTVSFFSPCLLLLPSLLPLLHDLLLSGPIASMVWPLLLLLLGMCLSLLFLRMRLGVLLLSSLLFIYVI